VPFLRHIRKMARKENQGSCRKLIRFLMAFNKPRAVPSLNGNFTIIFARIETHIIFFKPSYLNHCANRRTSPFLLSRENVSIPRDVAFDRRAVVKVHNSAEGQYVDIECMFRTQQRGGVVNLKVIF
jgi:hypothetical protein